MRDLVPRAIELVTLRMTSRTMECRISPINTIMMMRNGAPNQKSKLAKRTRKSLALWAPSPKESVTKEISEILMTHELSASN